MHPLARRQPKLHLTMGGGCTWFLTELLLKYYIFNKEILWEDLQELRIRLPKS